MRQLISAVTVILILVIGPLLPNSAQAVTRATAASADVWGACGTRTSENKKVRTFDRYRANAPNHFLRGGKSNLLCGNKTFGYRHILDRHRGEWEKAASSVRQNWREVADFSIETVLGDPDKVTYNPRVETYCFSRVIYLVNKKTGQILGTRIPHVVVALLSKRIITAFPSGAQCR